MAKKKDTTAIVKASDYDLDEQKAGEIQASFEPMIVERRLIAKEYEAIIKEEIDADVSQRARSLRLQLVKVRTGIADIHRTQKHMFLMAGRFVDAWKNAETLPVTQMEEKLTGIERHFENIEILRINSIRVTRVEELGKYEVADELCPANLGQMDEDVWSNYLAGVKESYRQRKEAEAKAEKERIAKEKLYAKEREELRIENERLYKEAAAREKAEEARVAKEAKANEKRERQEQARIEKEAKARLKLEEAARKEREKAEAKLAVERAARERLEQEQEDREEASRQEREAVEAREKDTAHRKAVNNAIVDAMVSIDPKLTRATCIKIVKAMVKGDIPNVSVNY